MYGFGDDRNPANDAVNVMEEILIEYIVDVVSGWPKLFSHHPIRMLGTAVFDCLGTNEEVTSFGRRYPSRSCKTSRCQETSQDGGASFHAGRNQTG